MQFFNLRTINSVGPMIPCCGGCFGAFSASTCWMPSSILQLRQRKHLLTQSDVPGGRGEGNIAPGWEALHSRDGQTASISQFLLCITCCGQNLTAHLKTLRSGVQRLESLIWQNVSLRASFKICTEEFSWWGLFPLTWQTGPQHEYLNIYINTVHLCLFQRYHIIN